MKKWSYWLSIIIGGIVGLVISKAWEIFNRPDRAISYQQEMFVSDTAITTANGQTKTAHILQGALWNSGKTTIDSTEVREPLLITVAGADEILHYELKREVHPQTSRFRLAPATKTGLSVHWQYFDPGDGFSFRILYVGDKKAKVKPKGRVLYVEGFDEVNRQTYVMWVPVTIIFFIALAGLFGVRYMYSDIQDSKIEKMAMLMVGNVSFGGLAVILGTELIKVIQNPPFEVYLGG